MAYDWPKQIGFRQFQRLICQAANAANIQKLPSANIQNNKMNCNPLKPKQQISKAILLPHRAQDLHQFEVICRVRPLQESETVSDITINEEKSTITIVSQTKNLTKEFQFNKIINEQISQREFAAQLSEQIFKYCRQSGKSSLVFSYGVTNSGKTYSILGTEENPGLLPYIIQKIETQFPEEQIKISAIQIYNDQFFSLKNKQKLCPKERGAFYQFDEYQPQHITKQSTRQMMKQYIINRYQSDTKSNKKSSRSHAIFKIETSEISIAIIDLAGSQRVNKAETNVQQSSAINLSLLTLGKCIHAIRDRISIPYRQSKLTRAIVQYFTPQSKIYMIAHINRSGEMFHQNVNVLEYAAVSTQVKQLNPQLNYSIVKSARKKIEQSKSKSCLKKKANSPPKSAKVLKETNSLELCEQIKQFDKRNQQNYNRNKKLIMQNYINRLKAKKEEFDFYLDCQFQKQDQKDIQFIQELKKTRYTSPEKEIQLTVQLVKAESRIKLRKEILEQIEKEKLNKQKDIFTQMGPSMRKCLEESIFRQKIQKNVNTQQQSQGDQNRVSLNLNKSKKLNKSVEDALSEGTPQKKQQDSKQSVAASLVKKSQKICNAFYSTAYGVVQFLRSVKKQPDFKQKIKKLAIDRQFQFHSQKQHHEHHKLKPKWSQQNLKKDKKVEKVSRGIGSFNIIQAQVKSQSLDFSDLLKDLDKKSAASSEENSMLLSNISQIQETNQHGEVNIMGQIRESEEFKLQNSPFFNHETQQPECNQAHQVQQSREKNEDEKLLPLDNKGQNSKITKKTEKYVVKQVVQQAKFNNTREQTTQGSDWENQTSKGSNCSLKTKQNQKGKKTKKPEMKFYIDSAISSLSPLKTRNQKAKASQSRPK